MWSSVTPRGLPPGWCRGPPKDDNLDYELMEDVELTEKEAIVRALAISKQEERAKSRGGQLS
jgi:hypothetical protein